MDEIKTKTMSEKEVGEGLSDVAVLKIEKTIDKLSKNSRNAQALTLAHNLKMSKDIPEKRKWIVLFYVSCFQLLSFINLGQNDKRTPEEYDLELKKLFKEVT